MKDIIVWLNHVPNIFIDNSTRDRPTQIDPYMFVLARFN